MLIGTNALTHIDRGEFACGEPLERRQYSLSVGRARNDHKDASKQANKQLIVRSISAKYRQHPGRRTFLVGSRLHGDDVGARVGLGHGQGAEMFTRDQL